MELQNSTEKDQKYFFAGPLNLDKMTRQASTVIGGSIVLGEGDFEALYTLAKNEGEFLTFQQLFEASWGRVTTNNIETSLKALQNLVQQVNGINEDLMKIEHAPEQGYRFITHWGHNWSKQSKKKAHYNINRYRITTIAS